MRTGASLGWRIATAVAFGATAALAVTLSRGVPLHAALTSDKGADAQHAAASARPASAAVTARCAASGLRISMGPGARVTTCTVRAARGQDYLRVHAIAPGASAGTSTGTVAAFEPSSPPARSPAPTHPAGTFARPGTEAD
jgi:hypothetical protein